jgi:hypothetical protein
MSQFIEIYILDPLLNKKAVKFVDNTNMSVPTSDYISSYFFFHIIYRCVLVG